MSGDAARAPGHRNGDGIEKGFGHHIVAQLLQAFGKNLRQPVSPAGNQTQSFRPVVDRIKPGNNRQQHLRRTYIAGGLLAANVLLAGLQGHT